MKLIPSIVIAVATLAISCKSDPAAPVSAFSSKAEAKASEDAKSGGVYKGVIAGSSGFFAVMLQNGTKEIRVTLDGEKRTLTPTGLDTWTSGSPIKNAVFTSGDWSATFSVGGSGATPTLTLALAGHIDAQVAILKELSTDVVRVYEGTYAGAESGTWNFVLQGPVCSGVLRSTSGTMVSFYGLVNGTSIALQQPISGSGTITVDTVTGDWHIATNAGTWTAKRVL